MNSIDDRQLESDIAERLLASPDVSAKQIRVQVSNGRVRLTGSTPSFRGKLAAHEIATDTPGVADVEDELEVDAEIPSDDDTLAEEIEYRLDAQPSLNSETVQIIVKRGEVTLSGYVNDERDRQIAEDIARGVGGVHEVKNFLIANPEERVADLEHGRAIQAAIQRAYGMADQPIHVSVVEDSVRLSGHVDADWKAELAEKITRRFDILHVRNEITFD